MAEALTSFVSYCGKVCIHMSTWIVSKTLVRNHFLQKNEFYRNLTMEGITDADYKHKKYVFESFRNKCLEIYELDLAYSLSQYLD